MSSGDNDDFLAEAKNSQQKDCHENQQFLDRLNDFMDKKERMLSTNINLKNCSAAQGIYLHGSLDFLSNENFTTVPPIEIFMDVPKPSQINHFYKNMERGRVVTGVISSLVDSGFYMTLIAVDVGQARNISDWNIDAFCPVREIPTTTSSHEDPLAMFAVKDKVRAITTKITEDKITISLLDLHLSNCLADIKLGIITDEETPLYYSRTLECQGRSYEEVLRNSLEYENPSNTGNLALMFGLCDLGSRPSLMEGLFSVKYDKKEYAEYLRKNQSYRLAMINVKEALRFFKESKNIEALQLANKALDIDPDNVEALVIRGALYANSEGYAKAVEDFEEALKFEPNHTNAKKYLIQVLIAYAKNRVNEDETSPARKLLKRAMELNRRDVDRDVSKLINDLLDDIVHKKNQVEKNRRRNNSRDGDGRIKQNLRSDRRIPSSSSRHNAVLKYYSPVYIDEDEVFGPELPPKITKNRKRKLSTSSSRSPSKGKKSKKNAKNKSRHKRRKREPSRSLSSSQSSSSSSSSSSTSSDHEIKRRSCHHSKVKAKIHKKQSPNEISKCLKPNRDSKNVPWKEAEKNLIKNMVDSSSHSVQDDEIKIVEIKKASNMEELPMVQGHQESLLFVNKERPGETLEEMELFLQKLKGKQKKI